MRIEYKKPISVYAAWRLNETERAKSSSGGIASVISEKWIENGGVVYGASFVRPFGFQHVRCTKKEHLDIIRGSKYVFSSVNKAISQIEDDINQGKKVLFIGTPCQVAGIESRFYKYKEQLVCIDLLCHGTPNEKILKGSIDKNIIINGIDNVIFRNNGKYEFSVIRKGQVVYKRQLKKDLYMKGFFKGVFNRDCCYNCAFSRSDRISDLTLGDFWGVDLSAIGTSMEKGVSLLLVNTSKGYDVLKLIRNEIVMKERPYEEAISGNMPLNEPVKKTWRYSVFKSLYPKLGFKWAAVLAMPDIVIKNLLK